MIIYNVSMVFHYLLNPMPSDELECFQILLENTTIKNPPKLCMYIIAHLFIFLG